MTQSRFHNFIVAVMLNNIGVKMVERRLHKEAKLIFNEAVEAMMAVARPGEDLCCGAHGAPENDPRVNRAEQRLISGCAETQQNERPAESALPPQEGSDATDNGFDSDAQISFRPMRIETSSLKQYNIDAWRFGSAIILCNLASTYPTMQTFRNDRMEKALFCYQMAHTILSDLLFDNNEEARSNSCLDWGDKRLLLYVLVTNNIIRINEVLGRRTVAWRYINLLERIGIVMHTKHDDQTCIEYSSVAPAA